jgi:hypothetical protein
MLVRIAIAVCCLAGTCFAQAVWTKRASQSAPKAWLWQPLAYDARSAKTVAYGNGGRSETWTWDGKTWARVATTGPRAAIDANQMVYDTANRRILLVSDASSSKLETWTWNGAAWTKLTPMVSPPRRVAFGLAYDSKRKVVVMFGGYGGNGGDRSDTWEFDGTNWRQRSSGGPYPRFDMEMAYDEARGLVVLFGGQHQSSRSVRLGDTWVWDGKVWLEHFGIPGPGKRTYASMAYDSKRQVVVLTGGTDRSGTNFDDTWEWNGKTWTKINPTTAKPSKDHYGAMAFDSARDVMVLVFGNSNKSETWEYSNKPLPKATFSSFGTGCAGIAGIPLLAASSGQLPRLGQTFQVEISKLPSGSFVRAFGLVGVSNTKWLNLNLPIDLRFIGMPGCKLLVSMDIMQGLTIVNNKATWSFNIPNDPTLAGGPFFLQSLVFEPGVNVGGAIVSNGGAGKMGL